MSQDSLDDFKEEQDIQEAIIEIAKRLGYVKSQQELEQISEVTAKEIQTYSFLLTIAQNLIFTDLWELDIEIDIGASAIITLIYKLLSLKISKSRKSRKELLQLIKNASETVEQGKLDKMKDVMAFWR